MFQIWFSENQYVFMSWGVHPGLTPVTYMKNAIIFEVNGFKHSGFVRINFKYDDPNIDGPVCSITLLNKNKAVVKTIDHVYISDVVNTIDNEVEYTGDNYGSNVDKYVDSSLGEGAAELIRTVQKNGGTVTII